MGEIAAPFQLSDHLILHPVTFNHSEYKTNIEKFGSDIEHKIASTDGSIFEYLPAELVPNIKPLSFEDNSRWQYFRYCQELAIKHHKDIYMMDPANDLNFAFVRGLHFPIGAAVGYTAARIHEAKTAKKLNRRTFLLIASAYGITSTFITLETDVRLRRWIEDLGFTYPQSIPSDATFRRRITAAGILKLNEDLKTNNPQQVTNLTVLYPESHWKVIQSFLENPIATLQECRDLKQNISLVNTNLTESFFSIRHFRPRNGELILTGKTQI